MTRNTSIVALLVSLAAAGCGPSTSRDPGAPTANASLANNGTGGTGSAASAAEDSPAARLDRRERGRKLYLAECSGCHGEHGKGDGPAAEPLAAKPRNFTAEKFKFRSTPSQKPPLREDVLETIARGMPGSAMPAFTFLTDDERGLLADYVRWLARIDTAPVPPKVEIGTPVASSPASIARGKEIWTSMQCEKCHGPGGKGDGPSAETLVDTAGRKISARDLTTGLLRRGKDAGEIVRTEFAGIDGTPMPSYAGEVTNEQAWDLANFVLSLNVPAAPPPADKVAYGRAIVEQRMCYGCHVIEERGGRVGPSLDVSMQKLRRPWIREFLKDPRAQGKLYPFTPYRMPDLKLTPAEIDAIVALFDSLSGPEVVAALEAPAPKQFAKELVAQGQLLYFLKCTECHNLGSVVPTPEAKRQGPDLIRVTQRLRYDWIPRWVKSPVAVYPGTAMVDTNLTDEEIESVRAFLWTTSSAASPKQ
jgi:mono/diheme cytochrome c family protein